jgi:single-strand DNA-binding protein
MLIGNLGKDAETRFTPSGTAVTNFTVATSRRWKDQQSGEWKEETDWHDVVLWRSENISQYLLKGKQVFVEGRLQTRSWEDQNGNKRYRTEVIADNLILLRGGGAEGGGGGGSDEYSQQGSSRQQAAGAGVRNAGASEAEDHGITDDDVPF